MSELKDLVPPLEDCQRIPDGAFADSALVWAYTGNGYEVTSREVWSIVESIFPGISESGGFPLTTRKEGRAMLLKGYGNAIVPQAAAEFVRAFDEVLNA